MPSSATLAYQRAIQSDPCSYCGVPRAGTVDHIIPKAKGGGGKRWDWENWTAACPECNRKKDKGGSKHQHLSPLIMMLTKRHWERDRAVERLISSLQKGDVVYTEWGEKGTVDSIQSGRGVRDVYVWLLREERIWRCANPFALRDSTGKRLALKETNEN